MYVNLDIFKAYDVRGEHPADINAKVVYIIARAFAEYIRVETGQEKIRIVLASDARTSSPELKKGVLEGLLDEGVEVIDMGDSTTPMHYFVVAKDGADGGIMVTASHNAYQYNGLKFTKKGGAPIGDGIEVIKNSTKRGIFKQTVTRGSVVERTPQREYIDFLLSHVDVAKIKNLHVVLDAGGGMAGPFIKQLMKHIPMKITLLHGEPEFDRSQDEPQNPMNEVHLARLKNAMIKESADFGVAFDPDGDRSGFITRNARFFRADYVAALFAREFLKKNPGAAMVYDVRSSAIFKETVETSGGEAILSRVGHSFIKAAMREHSAIFAAELSGHFYFKDSYYTDSDFLPTLLFAQILVDAGKSSDALLEEFEKYPSSGEINFKINKSREHILEDIAGHFADAKSTEWVDGLSLYYDDWWANIRPSNTEPYVRLNVEARDKNVLDAKLEELKHLLAES